MWCSMPPRHLKTGFISGGTLAGLHHPRIATCGVVDRSFLRKSYSLPAAHAAKVPVSHARSRWYTETEDVACTAACHVGHTTPDAANAPPAVHVTANTISRVSVSWTTRTHTTSEAACDRGIHGGFGARTPHCEEKSAREGSTSTALPSLTSWPYCASAAARPPAWSKASNIATSSSSAASGTGITSMNRKVSPL